MGKAHRAIRIWAIASVVTLMAGCTGKSQTDKQLQAAGDPHAWLEGILDPKALEWVDRHNASTLDALTNDPRYGSALTELRALYFAKDRIHAPSQRGKYFYHFLQDETHVAGLWRRTTLESYLKDEVDWESVLDVDALPPPAKDKWVYKGANCLEPEAKRCLLTLSPGGGDASVLREFDTVAKEFVADGFELPVAKSDGTWLDEDHLLVATDFGPGSLTRSGYARIVKVWKRGTPLSEAKTLFEGEVTDVSASAMHVNRPEGGYTFVFRSPSFFEQELHFVTPQLTLKKVPLPIDSQLMGVFDGQILASLRSDWKAGKNTFKSGSLIALPITALDSRSPAKQARLVFEPTETTSLSELHDTKSFLLLNVLDNVKNKLLKVRFVDDEPIIETEPLPTDGALSVVSASTSDDKYLALGESFLTPSTLYLVDGETVTVAKQLPARFDAAGMTVQQLKAKSADGTEIPYFLVLPKGAPMDGSTPTLLYGYGGFEVSLNPWYIQSSGKLWLEKGGAFVVANIRGGGEFGPAWHQAALKENRQRAYDDFIAVAEHLISTKVTSSAKLGIQGGSNGGLLMGVMLTQRPDLFNAILCEVPLLDMLRFHKLLAGDSWMGEYGNPDIAEEAAYIAQYSPYQNVRPGMKYPKVFFKTSTEDDRVHPGHARKMAAKMEQLGYPFFYYENRLGGHSAAENLEAAAKSGALAYTYLYQQLMTRPPETAQASECCSKDLADRGAK